MAQSVGNGKPTPGKDGASTGGQRVVNDPDARRITDEMSAALHTIRRRETFNQEATRKLKQIARNTGDPTAKTGFTADDPADTTNIEDRRTATTVSRKPKR